jgi:hypothetical protein
VRLARQLVAARLRLLSARVAGGELLGGGLGAGLRLGERRLGGGDRRGDLRELGLDRRGALGGLGGLGAAGLGARVHRGDGLRGALHALLEAADRRLGLRDQTVGLDQAVLLAGLLQVQRGQVGALGADLRAALAQNLLDGADALLHGRELDFDGARLFQNVRGFHRRQLFFIFRVQLRAARVAVELLDLLLDQDDRVLQAAEVRVHALELAHRLVALGVVLRDPGGLVEERAPVLGLGADHLVDAALVDDRVAVAAEPGVQEHLANVAQTALRLVQEVLRLAGAEQAARDRDLGELDRQEGVRVVERQRDLGHRQRRALGGSREDHVRHRVRAQGLPRHLAEAPAHRFHHVRLAAAVRPDDARDAGLQVDVRLEREGLVAADVDRFQVHGTSSRTLIERMSIF